MPQDINEKGIWQSIVDTWLLLIVLAAVPAVELK